MKLAMIGSYGHVGTVLGDADACDVEIVAAARWGTDDPMQFVGKFSAIDESVVIYEDYEKMLNEVRPDIVGVFMPLYRNAEASIAAARAGCHIISEKPLATELSDLSVLRDEVERAGVTVAALMTARCEPRFQAIRQAVLSGRIGRPILASAQKSYPFAKRDDFYKLRRTYGGSIPWQGIHAIDFVSYCTGKDYARAAAMHANTAHPNYSEMEDNGAMLFELAGGGHAVISFDYLRPWGKAKRNWGDERLRIAGTEGVIELTGGGEEVSLMTPDATQHVPLGPGSSFLAEFVSALQGQGQGLVSTAESFRLTEVALKARQAADENVVVDLKS